MSRKSAAVACFIFLVGALFLPSLVLAGSATVTWQPNMEPDLAKYRVYWSTTAGTYGSYKAEVPKGTTTYAANGLTEGKTYYFVLTAVDVSGNESGFSSPPASKTIPGGTGAPPAPALSSPTNGGSAPGTSVTFKWQASTGATDYNIRIYTESGGLALDRWVGNVLTYTVPGFSNTGKSFSWIITASNSFGRTSSARWTFVNRSATPAVPPAPLLSSPSNGASAPGTSLTFKWQAATGATDYNIKIYTATGSLAFDRWVGNVLTYTIPGFSNTGKSFSWAITPRNSVGQGPASARWTFVNGSATPAVPPAPALTSPSNGANAPGTSVTFKWQAVTGATSYNIRIYTETGGIALDQWVGSILSHTVNGFSNTGKSFSWNVRARNSSGLGPFSAKRTFINGNGTASTALSAPVLSFPSNGGSAPGANLTFKWQAVQGATDYNIKIYTATGGLAFDRWVGNTQSYLVYGFNNGGKTWLWTITAKNEAGTGPASARWSFVNK